MATTTGPSAATYSTTAALRPSISLHLLPAERGIPDTRHATTSTGGNGGEPDTHDRAEGAANDSLTDQECCSSGMKTQDAGGLIRHTTTRSPIRRGPQVSIFQWRIGNAEQAHFTASCGGGNDSLLLRQRDPPVVA